MWFGKALTKSADSRAHITGEADKLDAAAFEFGDLFPRHVLQRLRPRRSFTTVAYASLGCLREARRILLVADHDLDARVRVSHRS